MRGLATLFVTRLPRNRAENSRWRMSSRRIDTPLKYAATASRPSAWNVDFARRKRGAQPPVGQNRRADSPHDVAQRGEGLLRLLVAFVNEGSCGLGVAGEPLLGHDERHRQGHQLLAGAIVEVTFDTAALLFGGVDHA